MFDHMCPVTFKPDEAVGAPLHPHRGHVHLCSRGFHLPGNERSLIRGLHYNRFEAVTVMLQGELEHRDSMGNKGLLRAGDVQRLTAGSGVVHDEGPSPNMKRLGGTIESFQVRFTLFFTTSCCSALLFDSQRTLLMANACVVCARVFVCVCVCACVL
jgi:hypothetical protein